MSSNVSVFGSPAGGIVCKCRLCGRQSNIAVNGPLEPGTLYARVQEFSDLHTGCKVVQKKAETIRRLALGDIRERTKHLAGPSWKDMAKREWANRKPGVEEK